MRTQIKKEIKEVPHDKSECTMEMRWFLVRLLDEKDGLKHTLLIKMILEHLRHLE